MSLGPNGLVIFPLPVLQGSGRILIYPQALAWDGEDKKRPRKNFLMFMLGFLGPGKIVSRLFWSCFFTFCLVLGGGNVGE